MLLNSQIRCDLTITNSTILQITNKQQQRQKRTGFRYNLQSVENITNITAV